MDFKPLEIIVHHSLTQDSGSVSWGAIRKYHTQTLKRPYKDIGYHAGVELVKSGQELYYEILMGRMWDTPGAHVRGHNQDSLGLCLIGNFDLTIPTLAQLQAGAKIVSLWLELFDLTIGDIHLHREYDPNKSCPGRQFSLRDFKSYIF